MLTKEYIAVKNYEGEYEINNSGYIKSLVKIRKAKLRGVEIYITKRERILRYSLTPDGYPCVVLYKDKKRKIFKVHTLVWDHFGNSPRNGHILQVDHIDGNKQNASITNLRLLSNRENCTYGKLSKKKSGLPTGVYYDDNRKKYVSQINIKGKTVPLGRFLTIDEAYSAYQKALKELL